MNILTPSNFQDFCARKFLAEKKRILRTFTKKLKIKYLCQFWQNLATFQFQKSTPNFQKALTFENLASLQKRMSRQKNGKKSPKICTEWVLMCKNWPTYHLASTAKQLSAGRKRPIFEPESLLRPNFFLVVILNIVFIRALHLFSFFNGFH